MDGERARYLLSDAGRSALEAADPALPGLGPVAMQARLRASLPAFEASAIAEQLTLRAEAASRWGEPAPLLLTREGLEMMTHPVVARRRAGRFAAAGLAVADLTCGLGGDLAALTATGTAAVGVEHDAVVASLAAANVPSASVVVGDALRPPLDVSKLAVFLDPGRRTSSGRRTFDPAAFVPPLDICLEAARSAKLGAVKTAPGIDHRWLPPDAEAEWVQLGRVLRECTIWRGAGTCGGLRRAVHLPSGEELTSEQPQIVQTAVAVGDFVADPESCVTRAGLVAHLAHRLGGRLLDPMVAYLGVNRPSDTALASCFAVLAVLPFSLSRLRRRLRDNHWRPAEIRRRAFPIEPDELRRLLGAVEGDPVALLCTTIAGRRTVIVARPVSRNCAGV